MRLQLERRPCPIATLLLVTDEEGILRGLEFADHEARMHRLLRSHYGDHSLKDDAAPRAITDALDAYFEGETDALDKISVATNGTSFQRQVWKALREIPTGTTITYGTLAANVGRPSASRAVGAANGANPIAIVVPCHRVIGANGTLTGYASGLEHKKWLLNHEQQHAPVLAG